MQVNHSNLSYPYIYPLCIVPVPILFWPIDYAAQSQVPSMVKPHVPKTNWIGKAIFSGTRISPTIPGSHPDDQHGKRWDVEQQFFFLSQIRNQDVKSIVWATVAKNMTEKFGFPRSVSGCKVNFKMWADVLPNYFYENGDVKILIYKNKIRTYQRDSDKEEWAFVKKIRRLTAACLPSSAKDSQTSKRNREGNPPMVVQGEKRIRLESETTNHSSSECSAPTPSLSDVGLHLSTNPFDLEMPKEL